MLRAVHWNVRRFCRADGKTSSVDDALMTLRALGPLDVLSLNEVDALQAPEALSVLASALGLHAAFYGHARDGQYGNALLTSSPLERRREVRLDGGSVVNFNGTDHRIVRGLLTGEIALRGGGGTLRVATTHLDHISEAERSTQAAHVVRELAAAEDGGGPSTLLLGDLNALTRADYDDAQWQLHEAHRRERGWEPPADAAATGNSLALLAAANFSDVSRAVLHSGSRGWQSQPWTAHTCETDGPPYRIDYALVRPGTPSLTPVAAHVHELPVGISDHRPCVVDFKVG